MEIILLCVIGKFIFNFGENFGFLEKTNGNTTKKYINGLIKLYKGYRLQKKSKEF